MAMTYTILIANGRHDVGLGMIISSLCALVIGWPASYHVFKLMALVDRNQQRLRETNRDLEKALREVKELSGLLPICASCKKIRDDAGYWNTIEKYLAEHSRAELTHSICPDCAKLAMDEMHHVAGGDDPKKGLSAV